jgi:hypothetical protein
MADEVANLIKEVDEWVVTKSDALKVVILLMAKFSITSADIVDEVLKLRKEVIARGKSVCGCKNKERARC